MTVSNGGQLQTTSTSAEAPASARTARGAETSGVPAGVAAVGRSRAATTVSVPDPRGEDGALAEQLPDLFVRLRMPFLQQPDSGADRNADPQPPERVERHATAARHHPSGHVAKRQEERERRARAEKAQGDAAGGPGTLEAAGLGAADPCSCRSRKLRLMFSLTI